MTKGQWRKLHAFAEVRSALNGKVVADCGSADHPENHENARVIQYVPQMLAWLRTFYDVLTKDSAHLSVVDKKDTARQVGTLLSLIETGKPPVETAAVEEEPLKRKPGRPPKAPSEP